MRTTPARPRSLDHLTFLAANAFELFLCALTVVAALQYAFSPDALYESTVGRAVHPLDYGWLGLYGVGGASVCAGLLLRSPRLEVAGLFAYAAGVACNLVALVALVGNQSITGICTYVALILAALTRAYFVWVVTTRVPRA